MKARPTAEELRRWAEALLERAGLEPDKAGAVAEILVEGDLLGHTTHGLALLPSYLGEIESGAMRRAGAPEVVADFPAAVTWDGRRLPGPWLAQRAIELAAARARVHGTGTVVVRRSHHIACLAAYLRPVAERGQMIVLTCSDPNIGSVAPHGGRQEVFTPNPIAAAWPTGGQPVMLDLSASITTNAMTKRLSGEGRRFPGQWALTPEGEPTDDPKVLYAEPPGTLLPTGGVDHGHKGYALALLVEALTGGLAGHGRADAREGWGATVCVQVFEPALFGGAAEFRRQTEWVAAKCRATPPRAGFARVRLPGELGLQKRAEQLRDGVDLHPSILPALRPWVEKLGAPLLPSAAE